MLKTKTQRSIGVDLMMPSNTIDAFIYGQILDSTWMSDFNMLSISYRYFYLNEDKEVNLKNGSYILNKDQINQLASSVSISSTLKTDKERELFYKGFLILMAQNYNISVNDIEII